MQLPTVRLPAVNFGDWFEDFPARRFLLYALYTIVLFLLFLVINFPYRVLVDGLVNDVNLAPAEVSVHDASLVMTRGLELRGLTVRRPDWSRLPILEVPRAYLWPGLAGVLQGRLSKADIKGDLYSGKLKARWTGGDDLQRSIVQIEDLQVARYGPLQELFEEGQIFGLLSGYVELEGPAGDVDKMRAEGELYLDRAGSEGLVLASIPMLDLAFLETKAVFTFQGGRLEIQEFSSTGPDVEISGSGQIGVRAPFDQSVLDLKVTIQPAADARPEVKGLVSLIPRKKGARADAPISITGTLSKPRVR